MLLHLPFDNDRLACSCDFARSAHAHCSPGRFVFLSYLVSFLVARALVTPLAPEGCLDWDGRNGMEVEGYLGVGFRAKLGIDDYF